MALHSEGRKLDGASRSMAVRAGLEMETEDLVDDLDVVEQPPDQNLLVAR